ncbi:MAG: CarD family transcriptional regulator [Deltaproteobacteria bacterium]|nr:MAG: CarD family transcriptional regulator [Deltaproteobacteria bacterium]
MNIKKDNEKTKTSKQKVRKFKVGDLAVYPAHGVGKINSIESKIINGEEHDFYMMKILENEMTIMIPTWNVEQVGLRDVIDEEKISNVFEVMKKREESPGDTQTWNRRYREYMEKIKTGSLYDVAEVYRDLSLLKLTKDLSFGERKLYDTAQTLLVTELSIARNTDEQTIISEMKLLFPPKQPESVDNSDHPD